MRLVSLVRPIDWDMCLRDGMGPSTVSVSYINRLGVRRLTGLGMKALLPIVM